MQSDGELKNSHPSALPEGVQDPVPDQCSPHIYVIVANINALLIFRRLPLIDLQICILLHQICLRKPCHNQPRLKAGTGTITITPEVFSFPSLSFQRQSDWDQVSFNTSIHASNSDLARAENM